MIIEDHGKYLISNRYVNKNIWHRRKVDTILLNTNLPVTIIYPQLPKRFSTIIT